MYGSVLGTVPADIGTFESRTLLIFTRIHHGFHYLNKVVSCASGNDSDQAGTAGDSRSVGAFNFNGVVVILDQGCYST